MSLRGVQRRSNLCVIVGTERDGEIAAASLGWPRNDMGDCARNDIGKTGDSLGLRKNGATRRVFARHEVPWQSLRRYDGEGAVRLLRFGSQ